MSIRTNTTTGSTGYIANQKDSLNRLIHEVRELKRAMDAIGISITTIIGAGYATEATLQQVENNTDGLEGLATTANGLLTSIDGNLSGLATEGTLLNVEALLTNIDTNVVSCDTVALETILNQLSRDQGGYNADTLRVVLEDGNRDDISTINTYQSYANWDMIPGRSKTINWVAGTIQPFVVDTIEYYSGASLMVTQTFTYDANDNVTSITAS